MNAIGATLQIILVSNDMFPESPLPYRSLPMAPPRFTQIAFAFTTTQEIAGESLFHHPPTKRIVGVTFGKRPNRMEVVGKQNHGDNFKRSLSADRIQGTAQATAAHIRVENRPSFMGHGGEEVSPAGHIVTPVIRLEASAP